MRTISFWRICMTTIEIGRMFDSILSLIVIIFAHN
jgi:hypothetical protein